jgi:hypothetical protein
VPKHVTIVHKQKWLLLFNFDEAYLLYKQWYLYASVGFSSFFEIRPRNIVTAGTFGPHSLQNVKLMLTGSEVENLNLVLVLK